ncbi:MAG: FeS-binding protein [Deltaproteobacteria bacterium]|nr:FeS-binding protein [Deltaproteobacteria bacterium]MBW2116778.1 FeS-binding protein [Deltaproteobacteria bacterium]MBW2345046.1 FeS-binding protein [Deltaproteobacteria bacterium]
MAFTGFGQMPIFKRYYVSDIPGMGWSADFYLTHYIHYIGAIFLLALIAYVIIDYIFSGRKEFRLTSSAYVRIALLGGVVITGIFRVFKNLPDVVFSPGFTLFIDISHLCFMMLYLLTALVFLIMKSRWVRGIDD